MQIGDRLNKDVDGYNFKYADMAVWCNENNATIENHDDYVEIVQAPEVVRDEVEELKAYLSSTDWMVIKCAERGLSMLQEYPMDYLKRQSARNRINEIEGAN